MPSNTVLWKEQQMRDTKHRADIKQKHNYFNYNWGKWYVGDIKFISRKMGMG